MDAWMEMLGTMNTAFPILLVVILGLLLFTATRGMRRSFSNHKLPLLCVSSIIVGKRTEVYHRHDSDHSVNRTDTIYYLTFEVESGDRIEFAVSGEEYGKCAEGDEGKLTFQGSRYDRFERLSRVFRSTAEPRQIQDYRRSL